MSRMYSVMTGTDARPVVQGLPPEVELLAEPESPPEAEAESVPFIEIGGPAGPVFSAALAPPPPKAPEVKIKSEALREFPRIVAPAPAAVTTPAPSAEAPAAPVLSVRFHDVLQRHAPRGAEGPDPGLVALHYPDHPVSSEYRILRDEVARQLPDATSRVLSFTAAAAEAGTTTVVLNLAVTLARGDQRVLVMDANFNRPGVAAKLALHPSPGLAEVLGGHLPLPWALQPTAAPGLQALACGASPDADHEPLGEAVGRDLPK